MKLFSQLIPKREKYSKVPVRPGASVTIVELHTEEDATEDPIYLTRVVRGRGFFATRRDGEPGRLTLPDPKQTHIVYDRKPGSNVLRFHGRFEMIEPGPSNTVAYTDDWYELIAVNAWDKLGGSLLVFDTGRGEKKPLDSFKRPVTAAATAPAAPRGPAAPIVPPRQPLGPPLQPPSWRR